MKTNIIKSALLLLAALSMTLASCRKDEKEPETDTTSLQQITADENRVSQAADAAMNEVNDVISHSGNKSLFWVPCNATVDSSNVVNDTIIYFITYNGLNCHGNLHRTGQLTIHKHVSTPWAQAGCKVYVHFTNFVVTRVSNNKTVTLSGVKIYENVSGGLLKNLGTTETSIVHRVFGNIQATFDDNSVCSWQVARQRTFTGVQGNFQVSTEGFGSAGGYTNLVTWGLTRSGENFYTRIDMAVVHREACGWDPVSGIKVIEIPGAAKKATITFGYDANNQPVSGGACPTHYMVTWEKNGNTGTLFLPL